MGAKLSVYKVPSPLICMDPEDKVLTTLAAFEEKVAESRSTISGVEEMVLALKRDPLFSEPATEGVNGGEAIANIMLAYRHLEDARMRLGKVFQALNGGVSNNTR